MDRQKYISISISLSILSNLENSTKTDNHATFTNYYVGCNRRSNMKIKKLHELDQYLIDKDKPAQNGTTGKSHKKRYLMICCKQLIRKRPNVLR